MMRFIGLASSNHVAMRLWLSLRQPDEEADAREQKGQSVRTGLLPDAWLRGQDLNL